jgi:radical SAM protein with 4Fe4S-binding SPASM domain
MAEKYKKLDSFINFTGKFESDQEIVLSEIDSLFSKSRENLSISKYEQTILDRIYKDLFIKNDNVNNKRFSISKYAIDEILSYKKKNFLPKYLVHRYRYEMFPKLYELDNYPPYLQIEPTSFCNFRCVFCYQTDGTLTSKNNGHMGHMTIDTFKSIVDQTTVNIEFVSLASRGEPLLCPDIEEMLAYTRDKYLNLKMNTNASLLNESKCHAILKSGIKTLVFSADAAREPDYSKYRVNGSLKIVLKNIERFQNIKTKYYSNSELVTRVSGVKFDDSQDIESMKSLWGQLVDQVTFVDYLPWENTYTNPINDITTPCSDLWRRMFIWWDGKVNPCDVDYLSSLSVGNILDSDISSFWKGKQYSDYRDKHLSKLRGVMNPCNKCTFT